MAVDLAPQFPLPGMVAGPWAKGRAIASSLSLRCSPPCDCDQQTRDLAADFYAARMNLENAGLAGEEIAAEFHSAFQSYRGEMRAAKALAVGPRRHAGSQ